MLRVFSLGALALLILALAPVEASGAAAPRATACAGLDGVRAANATRGRQQASARARAQSQAQARAQAQAQARQRAKVQAAQRAQAQAGQRNQAAQRENQRRQASQQNARAQQPQREDLQRPASVRGNNRRAARETDLAAEAPMGAPDWDSLKDQFNDQGDAGDHWQQVRGEIESRHAQEEEVWAESEWSSAGFIIGGSGYGYGGWTEEPGGWEDDNTGYSAANNEFYATDDTGETDPSAPETATDAATAGQGDGGSREAGPVGVAPLPGERVTRLSAEAVVADTIGERLYFDRGVFYRDHEVGKRFEVVTAPIGAIVPALPAGYRKVTLEGTEYSVFHDVYYKSVYKGGKLAFMVAQVGG